MLFLQTLIRKSTAVVFFCIFFSNTLLYAQQQFHINKWGEVTDPGFRSLISKRKYQAISGFDTVSKKPLLLYALFVKNGKLGILDISGKEITSAQYDAIDGLNKSISANINGFKAKYIVKADGKMGLIDNRGKLLLPLTYDNLYYEAGDSVFATRQGNRWIYINAQGKTVQHTDERSARQPYIPEYDIRLNTDKSRYYVKGNYKKVEMDIPNLGEPKVIYNQQVIFFNKSTRMYGLYNTQSNKLVIPVEYERIELSPPGFFIVFKSNSYGVIDSLGQIRLPVDYEGLSRFTGGALLYKNKKYALFDSQYKQLTGFEFDSYNYLGEIIVLKKNGKSGILDQHGKVIVDFKYDNLQIYNGHELKSPVAVITVNGRQGLIDLKGKELVAPEYDLLLPQYAVSSESNTLYPEPFFDSNIPNRFFYVSKNQKYGLLGNNYQVLVPLIYDNILGASRPNLITVKQNGKWGVLDVYTKKMLLPLEFDWRPIAQSGGYFLVLRNHNYGLYNINGKVIIPATEQSTINFDDIYNGLIYIRNYESKTRGYADIYGNRVTLAETSVIK